MTTALEMIARGELALGTEKCYRDEWRYTYAKGECWGAKGYQVLGGE